MVRKRKKNYPLQLCTAWKDTSYLKVECSDSKSKQYNVLLSISCIFLVKTGSTRTGNLKTYITLLFRNAIKPVFQFFFPFQKIADKTLSRIMIKKRQKQNVFSTEAENP